VEARRRAASAMRIIRGMYNGLSGTFQMGSGPLWKVMGPELPFLPVAAVLHFPKAVRHFTKWT